MFTCFVHSWYSLTDQCPQCSRTGGSSDSTELIINPTPEGVSADSLSDGEKQYAKGLAQNLGKVQPYHYSGPRCVPGCKNFAAYETKHHKDCPYYSGSLSEKQDEEIARLKEDVLKSALEFVRNLIPVASRTEQLSHVIGELEMFVVNYGTDNTTYDEINKVL